MTPHVALLVGRKVFLLHSRPPLFPVPGGVNLDFAVFNFLPSTSNCYLKDRGSNLDTDCGKKWVKSSFWVTPKYSALYFALPFDDGAPLVLTISLNSSL